VHLGIPRMQHPSPTDNSRDGARRSVEALQEQADALGVRIAVEVIPNELSRAGSLVYFVEEVVNAPNVGICFDFGHAHLEGDVSDALETVSEHLITTHVHDNRGRTDDHLVPFDGTIDWPAALTGLQKVGYDGAMMLELAAHGSPKDTLQKARRARERMERFLAS
jgi:sugar phosphate isomerase/epimerase